jgi:hypothetical protein
MSHYYPEAQLLKYRAFVSYEFSNMKFLKLFLLKALFTNLVGGKAFIREELGILGHWSLVTAF